MARILKRSSFGLLRTNPKLTTNIKIIGDSNNKVYLESIDADPILSKAKYKGYEVTGVENNPKASLISQKNYIKTHFIC